MHYQYERPLAITMWDFSWLERRWPGAGYEDWDQALDGLKERGYDAVRIDAYPHLLAKDGVRDWLLKPEWSQQAWGAPAMVTVSGLEEKLLDFISRCRKRGLVVGLSTWFREDVDNTRYTIRTPGDLAAVWRITLDKIQDAGLLESILYVDICNEYPFKEWTKFLPVAPGGGSVPRYDPESVRWMKETLKELRKFHPELDYTFSEADTSMETLTKTEADFLDFHEIHIWFTQFTDFYEKVGYTYDRFVPDSFDRLVRSGEKYYSSKPEFFKRELEKGIAAIAEWSVSNNKPLISTECWGPVDYKDWPDLSWEWVKELCETGVAAACATGRWAAMATSNFCGPQFVGMWKDVQWHRRLTGLIHSGKLPKEL